MTLEELLKSDDCQARVEVDDKWLVWYNSRWFVLERKYYARDNTTHYTGHSLEDAIKELTS